MAVRTDLAIAAPLSAARPRPSARMAPAEGRAEAAAPAATPATTPHLRAEERGRWLHGPVLDFLLLGGGSFLVLGALAAFWPRDDAAQVALAGTMLLLAHFVNHPHFAHSYQIFYRGFVRKAFPRSRRGDAPPTGAKAPPSPGEGKGAAMVMGGAALGPETEAPLPPGEGFGVRGEQGSAPEPTPASTPESRLAARYRFAGLLVPAVLVAFFAAALAEGSVALLGLAANVMFFMVGWHYAKQGYGILMLDAARKGLRFAPRARRRLLWNTHLAWITFWLFANEMLKARELWGITYYFFDLPDPLLFTMAALVTVSTLAVGRDLLALWRAERVLPVNGLLAYIAAGYVWLLVGRLDPVLLLVVPFFHALQYLAVVWRYQLNVEEADRLPAHAPAGHGKSPDGQDDFAPMGSGAPLPREVLEASEKSPSPPERRVGVREIPWKAWLKSAPVGLARFILAGGVLGFAGFWLAPITIDALSGYDQAVFGATLFLFVGWTFINIHHYFIDNVIWRRENPETRRHLFEA